MWGQYHGLVYGVLAAIVSTILAVFIKLAADAPKELIVFARFFVGLPFVFWLASMNGVRFSFKEVPRHLPRGILGIAGVYLYVYAVSLLPLVNAMTLASTAPLFMPLIVLIRVRKLVSGRRFLATAIGFLGVVILLRPTQILLEWGSICAVGVGLISAYTGLERRLLSKNKAETTEKMLLYYFFLGSIISLYPMVITWQPIVSWNLGRDLLVIGVCSVIAQSLFTASYAHIPATKASIFTYFNIILGGVAGWLVFGEIPDLLAGIGSLLIIGGALLAFFDQTRARRL